MNNKDNKNDEFQKLEQLLIDGYVVERIIGLSKQTEDNIKEMQSFFNINL